MSNPTTAPPWMWPALAADALFRFAPNTLNQQVLPWNFNVTVNEQNSSAPDTERRIVQEESYGRQLGRIMDTLHALIDERPSGAHGKKPFRDFERLYLGIQRIKAESAVPQLERVRSDLALLKSEKPREFERIANELRKVLDGDG